MRGRLFWTFLLIAMASACTIRGEQRDAVVEQAEVCSVSLDEDVAAVACRKAIELGLLQRAEWPGTERFYRRFIDVIRKDGRVQYLAEVLHRAVRAQPTNAAFCLALGDKLVSQDDASAEAEKMYERAIRNDPSLVPAYTGLGRLRMHLGKVDGAEEAYARALQLDAQSRDALVGRAQVLAARGRAKEAAEILEEFVKRDSQDAFVWYLLGEALIDSNQPQAALTVFSRLGEVDSTYAADAHCGLSRAWRQLGNRAKAEEECQRSRTPDRSCKCA
jgi:predicted Zn-dependent protease